MKRLLLPLCVLLSGCGMLGFGNDAKHAVTYEQTNPIAVKVDKLPAVLDTQRLPDGRTRVSGDDENLRAVIDAYVAAGGGTVYVQTYGHGPAARKNVAAVIKRLAVGGIAEDTVKVEYLDDKGVHVPSQVIVSFDKTVAQAPDCRGAWARNSADAYRNTRRQNFGCATRSNLALTIVNPDDLKHMRPMGNAPASKRAGGDGAPSAGNIGPGGSSVGAPAMPAMPM